VGNDVKAKALGCISVWPSAAFVVKYCGAGMGPTFDDARNLLDRFAIFPLAEGSKSPQKGDRWRRYETERLSLADVRRLWGFEQKTRYNIGLLMGASRAVAVDVDDIAEARKLYKLLPKTEIITRTPRGAHLIYKAPEIEVSPAVKILVKGIVCDIRAGASYVVGPGSEVDGKKYQAIGKWTWDKVPVFDPGWLESKQAAKRKVEPIRDDTLMRIFRATKWSEKVEPAVEHQGWHDRFFWYMCQLRDKFGLTLEQAFPLVLAFNSKCKPPMCMRGISHKVSDVWSKTNGEKCHG